MALNKMVMVWTLLLLAGASWTPLPAVSRQTIHLSGNLHDDDQNSPLMKWRAGVLRCVDCEQKWPLTKMFASCGELRLAGKW